MTSPEQHFQRRLPTYKAWWRQMCDKYLHLNLCFAETPSTVDPEKDSYSIFSAGFTVGVRTWAFPSETSRRAFLNEHKGKVVEDPALSWSE